MWSHVKFVECGTTANVPTSFFKVIVDKTKDISELKIGNSYSVFWSPDNDTPTDLISRGNEIMEIDKLSEKVRKQMKKSGPLRGYFQAALLDLRITEDSTEDVTTVSATSSGRVKIPSRKVVESMNKSKESVNKPKAQTNRSCKQNDAKAAEAASKANIMNLLEKCATGRGKTPQQPSSDSSESSEDSSDDEETKSGAEDYKAKYEALLQDIKSRKAKKKPKKSKKMKEKRNESFAIKGKQDNKQYTKARHSDKPATITPGDKLNQSPPNDQQLKSAHSSQDKEGLKHKCEDAKSAPDDPDFGVGSAEAYVMQIKKRRVKPGQPGDSLFVMNEALSLWTHKTLAIRSPTGLPQSRKGSNGTKGYPKMTPEKVNKISEGLNARIKEERASPQEAVSRMGKLGYYLSQRCNSSRRALRDKGIAVPSAKAVAKVLEDDPTADGTAAYDQNEQEEPEE